MGSDICPDIRYTAGYQTQFRFLQSSNIPLLQVRLLPQAEESVRGDQLQHLRPEARPLQVQFKPKPFAYLDRHLIRPGTSNGHFYGIFFIRCIYIVLAQVR